MASKPHTETDLDDNRWSGMKLFVLGLMSLVAALAVIVYMGSRLGGCMYLDGSHPAANDLK